MTTMLNGSNNGGSNNSVSGDIFASFAAAQRQMQRAQQQLSLAREKIRSEGLYAPDSLLILCNSLVLSVLCFLHPEDVVRCEMTCKSLRDLAAEHWKHRSETGTFAEDPMRRSPSAVRDQDPRAVVFRHHVASTMAARIAGLGPTIIEQHVLFLSTRLDGYCHGQCTNCNDFPDLDFDCFRSPNRDDNFEFFVRFSSSSDNALLAEGFLPFEGPASSGLLPFGKLKTSKWPSMELLVASIEGDNLNEALLQSCMEDLTVTIIAIEVGSTLQAGLVAVQCNFTGGGNDENDYYHCFAHGELAERSHGDIETRQELKNLGGNFDSESSTTLSHVQLCLVYVKRTRRWVIGCEVNLAAT